MSNPRVTRVRRFNYTGRKKILREDIEIRLLSENDDVPVINAILDLQAYEFPIDADVFLEPQRKTRFMRIPLGPIQGTVVSNGIVLDEFDNAEDLQFRVKIVARMEGRLLGFADQIKPASRDDAQDASKPGIFPVVSTDLTSAGVLWQLEYSDQDVVLQIEQELGNKEQVVRSLFFRGFILPEAFRQILLAATREWGGELSDTEEFSTRWILFASHLGAGIPEAGPKSPDDVWIQESVRLLTRRINVRDRILEEFDPGAWK